MELDSMRVGKDGVVLAGRSPAPPSKLEAAPGVHSGFTLGEKKR